MRVSSNVMEFISRAPRIEGRRAFDSTYVNENELKYVDKTLLIWLHMEDMITEAQMEKVKPFEDEWEIQV